jgi:cell division protein FtsZ
MERELEIHAPRAAAPVQQPAMQETFRPQSKIFAAPEAAPVIRPAPVQQAPVHAPVISQPAPQPVMSQPAPVMQQPMAAQQAVRMPKVEDFPPVVQAEIDRRSQPAAPSHAHEERGPMGLLKRITNSLGRREEEIAPEMTSAPAAASQQRRQLSPEASLYAPRRGNLDDQGRSVPQARMMQEDDQLEIPAFLRRQSN